MKRATLIILISFIGFTSQAQNFGASADLGMSHYSGIKEYYFTQNTPRLYYSFGLFYTIRPDSAIWGLRTGIEFNKRGHKTNYLGNGISFSNSPITYTDNYSITSTNSLSLFFLPTLNVLKKFHLFLGPIIYYNLNSTINYETVYYKTSAKQEVIETKTTKSKADYDGVSFTERSSYGLKLGGCLKLSKKIDLGITYQISRRFKYYTNDYKPYYNILNLTTIIYLK
jgi:hypothetical protein